MTARNGVIGINRLVVVFVVIVIIKCAIGQQQQQPDCSNGNCTVPSQHSTNETTNTEVTSATTTDKTITQSTTTSSSNDEDQKTTAFPPTIPTTTIASGKTSSDEPKGRAINFTLDEHRQTDGNGLSANSSVSSSSPQPSSSSSSSSSMGMGRDFGDLSDVNMDNDDDTPIIMPKIVHPQSAVSKHAEGNETLRKAGICLKGGLTYEEGEKLENGCESICTCTKGKMDCTDRCSGPYIRKGKKIEDPLCVAKETDDPCCVTLVCAADTETEPLEMCSYNNKTYHRGETIQNGCDELCTCEIAGKVSCKPRCPMQNKTSDRCVEVPDPADSCCKMVLCDVTLEEHDHDEMSKVKILSAQYVNSSTISIKFDKQENNISNVIVDVGNDKVNWKTYQILPGGYLNGLDTTMKYIKLESNNDVIPIKQLNEPKETSSLNETSKKNSTTSSSSSSEMCEYKGKTYKLGDEFNDNCTSYCMCQDSGIMCAKLECPTYFGLDVVDPTCVEWETIPPNFVPTPPNCCPEKVKCKNNGSCIFKGEMYQNWQEIPSKITGCEQRCFCELGHVECQNVCPPVPARPPSNLPCPENQAEIGTSPEDDCCKFWMCKRPAMPQHPQIPGGSENTEKTDVNNRHTSPSKQHNSTNETPFLGPFAIDATTKSPSNVLGPLLVYENKPSQSSSNGSTVEMTEAPDLQNLIPFLHNPYEVQRNETSKTEEHGTHSLGVDEQPYQHLGPLAPIGFNPQKPTKTNYTVPSYAGPFNPDYKQPSPFPFLPEPDHSAPPAKPEKNKHKGKEPVKPNLPPPPPPPPQHPHQIHIHANAGSPEEILHLINQHPELTNYPPGSVFEIQQVPQKPNNVNPYLHPNNPVPPSAPNRQPPQQFIPYVVNEGPQGHPQIANGLPVDQILKHLQKGEIPPYLNIPNPNGPFVPNRQQNISYPGFGGGLHGYPGHFPPPYQQDDIEVHTLEPLNGHTVRLAFTVPPVIVGLHGRVEVRYTNTRDENLANWQQQVFAPPNDLIATPQLEFDLVDLQPNSEYKIKITVTLRDLQNTPSSRVYTVRTPNELPLTTLSPMIPIEPNLIVAEINATWVNIAWRKFTEYELQFIDGVQLRYKEIDESIYSGATPLIHRAVTNYIIENLKPNTQYELGIFFIPFPGQLTELHTERMIHFTTSKEIEVYGFNVTLEINHVKPTSVEVSWSGVPYPEDKYVNIYRAIYQSDSGKEDVSTFKIAKRDSPAKTIIMDLKPGTRYRLWLEVYLTNGKIKTSNVQDFITKPRAAPSLDSSSQKGKLSSDPAYPDHRGDYYGPLVIVAILAAIAILSTLILLLILVRRHSQNKAAITPPSRVSQSAYDNPTYKVEIQQETMDL